MDQKKIHNKIIYEYEQSPKSKLQYAHGVWGGINPHGEIELNFYTESDKVPALSECIVDADGTLGNEHIHSNQDARVIVRNIHSKVLINHRTAKSMIEWLEEKVALLEMDSEQGLSFPEDGSIAQ